MSIATDLVARAKARGETFKLREAETLARLNGRVSTPGPLRSADDVARRMADHMRDIEAVRGSVDEDDLLTRGWTLDAIRQHGTAARDLANAARERCV